MGFSIQILRLFASFVDNILIVHIAIDAVGVGVCLIRLICL